MKLRTGSSLFIAVSIGLFLTAGVFRPAWAREALQATKPAPLSPRDKAQKGQIIARLQRDIPQLMKDGDVPGLAIALVRNGELAWSHGFGVMNAQTKEPVTDGTVFEAASLSKPVFAYAVLKLLDGGQLDLDAPLTRYLPGNYDVGDDPRLNQITARRVLSHTTGFPNWRQRGGALRIYFTPGERFSYSGEGYVYLAKVIEHLTGERFNDFMKRSVFEPLGMTSSSYVWQESYDRLKASRHNSVGQPTRQEKPVESNAAASLHTTALDYGRFLAAVLNGTGLKKETLRQMLTPQVRVGEGGMNHTDRPPDRLSSSLSWGLGWGLQATKDGLSFWHWGDNGDTKAFVEAFVRQKLGVVVFTNSATGLSIMPDIINDSVGGEQPALAWINYESYKSTARLLFKNILANGSESALKEHRQWRKGRTAGEIVNEGQMNRIGYQLLSLKRVGDAIAVFRQNVEDYPQSFNAYDSLGEAYMVNGDKALAIRNYERSVELNSGNTNGIEMLKKLRENKQER
jgi:CubicO group peptidase (beta-lactamase class C family)